MNQELTTDDLIVTWLNYWGINNIPLIEEEAKSYILQALSDENTIKVYLDNEGALIIESD
jgi:hypothetical protein